MARILGAVVVGEHGKEHLVHHGCLVLALVAIVDDVVGHPDVAFRHLAREFAVVVVGVGLPVPDGDGLVVAILDEAVVVDVDVARGAAQPQIARHLAVVDVGNQAVVHLYARAHTQVKIGDGRILHVTVQGIDFHLVGMVNLHGVEGIVLKPQSLMLSELHGEVAQLHRDGMLVGAAKEKVGVTVECLESRLVLALVEQDDGLFAVFACHLDVALRLDCALDGVGAVLVKLDDGEVIARQPLELVAQRLREFAAQRAHTDGARHSASACPRGEHHGPHQHYFD